MAINIGNKNKIQNSIIVENSILTQNQKVELPEVPEKKSVVNKHPILCSLVVSFIVGFLLLFSFWKNIVFWIESLY